MPKQINTIDITPSTATLITPGSVPSLKRMTVAGELINPSLVPIWIDRLELMNACEWFSSILRPYLTMRQMA